MTIPFAFRCGIAWLELCDNLHLCYSQMRIDSDFEFYCYISSSFQPGTYDRSFVTWIFVIWIEKEYAFANLCIKWWLTISFVNETIRFTHLPWIIFHHFMGDIFISAHCFIFRNTHCSFTIYTLCLSYKLWHWSRPNVYYYAIIEKVPIERKVNMKKVYRHICTKY